MSEWIDFPRLGKCPVKPDTVVRVKFRCGRESRDAAKAANWRWQRFPAQSEPLPYDVIAYRVEGEA